MKSGFSLIELVIAMVISSFVVLSIYQVIDQVRRNTLRIEESVQYSDVVVRLDQEFTRTLSGMMVPGIPLIADTKATDTVQTTTQVNAQKKSPEKKQTEESKTPPFFAEIKNDKLVRLNCVTLNPLAVYDAISPRPVRVEYRLEEQQYEGNTSHRLVRQELRDLSLKEQDELQKAPVYELLDNVTSFSVRVLMPDLENKPEPTEENKKPEYTFKEEKPWGPNSEDEKHAKLLPHAVIIDIVWKSNERDYSHTVYARVPSALWYTELLETHTAQEKSPEKAGAEKQGSEKHAPEAPGLPGLDMKKSALPAEGALA